MKIVNAPYSLRCVNAIAELHGGRVNLARKLGMAKGSINNWFFQKRVSTRYVMKLVQLGEGKFSAEELLGKFDHVDNGYD